MYEELVKWLRSSVMENKYPIPAKLLDAANAIEALTAENTAKDAEIERLKKIVDAKEAVINLHEPTMGIIADQKDEAIRRMRKAEADLARVTAERDNLRNELCQRCGNYRMEHKDACDGCRWKKDGD